MSMFGARFAVFVRRARVLHGPCPATRNLCVLEVFTGTVTLLFQLVIFTGMVRVGMKIPHDGNRANTYGHVATGACVAQPVPCNS